MECEAEVHRSRPAANVSWLADTPTLAASIVFFNFGLYPNSTKNVTENSRTVADVPREARNAFTW
jgi:hypothetical protein